MIKGGDGRPPDDFFFGMNPFFRREREKEKEKERKGEGERGREGEEGGAS